MTAAKQLAMMTRWLSGRRKDWFGCKKTAGFPNFFLVKSI
jgi:hypothetical protein